MHLHSSARFRCCVIVCRLLVAHAIRANLPRFSVLIEIPNTATKTQGLDCSPRGITLVSRNGHQHPSTTLLCSRQHQVYLIGSHEELVALRIRMRISQMRIKQYGNVSGMEMEMAES